MVANVYPNRAAEKVLFRELFRNPADVARNGGTLVGSPEVKDGATLDGTSDYVNYGSRPNLMSHSEMSFVFDFTPDTAHDNSTIRGYMGLGTSATVSILKWSSAQFRIQIGSTMGGQYFTIPGWTVGERQRLVVAVRDGLQKAYLNGTELVTGTGTGSLVPDFSLDALRVGYGYIGSPFSGVMHSFSILGLFLTKEDVDQMEAGRLFSYPNRASVWLDFAEATAKAGTVRGTTELLSDGDMEAAGVGDWLTAQTVTKETTDPYAGAQNIKIHNETGGAANAWAYQSLNLSASKRYRVVGWARSDGTASPKVVLGGSTAFIVATTSGNWEYFDVTGVPSGGTIFYLGQNSMPAGGYAEFDNVSVVEIDELLSDSDMEATGTGEWTAVNSAVLSKVDIGSFKALRVAYGGGAWPYARQSVLAASRLYRITGSARGDGASSVPVIRCGSTNVVWTGTSSTDWQEFDVEVTAADAFFVMQNQTAAGYCEFGPISLRPVLARTLDKSPGGHVCLLGDGYTAADMPTFMNPGFSFDGGDYMNGDVVLPIGTSAFSMWALMKIGDYGASFCAASIEQADLATMCGLILINSAGYPQYYHGLPGGNQASNAPVGLVLPGQRVLLVGTGDGTHTYLYVDGVRMPDAVTPIATASTASTRLWVGKRGSGISVARPGTEVLHVGAVPEVLSPLQVHDLAISLGVNV